MDSMDREKYSFLQIQIQILNCLSESKGPVSAKEIAKKIGLSDRNVRNRIDDMKQVLHENGVDILSSPGFGYQLKQQSQDSLYQLLNSFMESSVEELISEEEQRVHYLIRYVLSHERIESIDQIASIFFVNSTTAKKILGEARKFLEEFELKIMFHKGKGLAINGKEINKRLCLVYEESFYGSLDHENEQQDIFKDILSIDNPARNKIKTILMQYQQTFDNYNFSQYSLDYISGLVCVSAYREKAGYSLLLSRNTRNLFTNRNTYYVAKMIANYMKNEMNISLTRDDTILLAMSLVAMRVQTEISDSNSPYYQKAKDTALDVVQNYYTANGFKKISKDLQLIESFSLSIEGIVTRNRYHFLTSQFVKTPAPYCSAMAVKLAIQAAEYIRETEHIDIWKEDIIRICQLVYPVFGRYPWTFKAVDAAVVSTVDIVTARGIAERLHRNFSSYIGRIQLYNIYESDKITEEIIFTDNISQMQKKIGNHKTIIPVILAFNEYDKTRIRQNLMRISDKDNDEINQMRDISEVFTDVEVQNQTQLLHYIASTIHGKSEDISDICEDFDRALKYYSFPSVNGVALFSSGKNHTERMAIKYYIMEKPMKWKDGHKIKMLIYWDCGIDGDYTSHFESEVIPHLLEHFRNDSESISRLIESENLDNVQKSFENIDNLIVNNASKFK